MREMGSASVGDQGEVGLVMAGVAGGIGVLDREAELLGQFGEASDIGRLLQKARETTLELVVGRHQNHRFALAVRIDCIGERRDLAARGFEVRTP